MPVPLRQSTISEMSQSVRFGGEELIQVSPRLDQTLFEEIKEYLDKSKKCQSENREDEKKIEKLTQSIETLREMIIKAEEKKEVLLKKNADLKNSLDSMIQRTTQASEYWKNYGLEIRKVSTDTDDFSQYEFIYLNLSNSGQAGGDTAGDDGDRTTKHSVNVRFHNKRLEIVSQEPATMLDSDQTIKLNEKLTVQCVNSEGLPDYRSAMILIKKTLIKNLFPSAKTCSHPPNETNNHTYT